MKDNAVSFNNQFNVFWLVKYHSTPKCLAGYCLDITLWVILKPFPALHTGAHIYNFEALIASWENTDPLVRQLNGYSDIGNITTRLNPIREMGLVRNLSSIVFVTFNFS